ncbi:hypothetical protein ALP44_101784 [Pseudomonas syringae pv. theae]|uniref:Uncharacterized protein n=2 Tax=Pseudomonas syringae TaxID=317 RepID=A0A3M5MGG3_PSESX|nr:hypothetical protein ALP44_101784 [Pseudomonas syringae pv. theae]
MLDLPLCAHVCSLDSIGTSPPAPARLAERGAGKALKKGCRQIPCPARRILYAITADETPDGHIAQTSPSG